MIRQFSMLIQLNLLQIHLSITMLHLLLQHDHSILLKMDQRVHIIDLESIRQSLHILHRDPEIHFGHQHVGVVIPYSDLIVLIPGADLLRNHRNITVDLLVVCPQKDAS